jgi:hypothetical protein
MLGLAGVGLRNRRAVLGMVVSIRTYGDLAHWQPQLRTLVSAEVFSGEGVFTPLAPPPEPRGHVSLFPPYFRNSCT